MHTNGSHSPRPPARLQAHLASDCIANPVPFLYGLLASAAGRAFDDVMDSDISDLVLIDATIGTVEAGAGAFLARLKLAAAAVSAAQSGGDGEGDEVARADEAASAAASAAAVSAASVNGSDPSLRFPEPLLSECVAEMAELAVLARSATAAAASAAATAAVDAPSAAASGGTGAGAPTLKSLSVSLQSLCVRFFSTLLSGYRACTFFPGRPPQFSSLLSVEPFVEARAAALGADCVAAAAAAAAAAATSASSSVRSRRGKGAASSSLSASPAPLSVSAVLAAARAFLHAFTQTQMFAGLLQRHTGLSLRPFHALSATLPPAPRLCDSKGWVAPVCSPAALLIVPPPGFGSASACLSAWQLQQGCTAVITSTSSSSSGVDAALLTGLRLLPAAGITSPGGSATAKGAGEASVPKQKKKKDKREDAEIARKWSTGEVCASLLIPPASAAELELLVSSSSRGSNGNHGDDVGALVEQPDDAAAETAALLAAAAEAAGADSNPVIGTENSRRIAAAETGAPGGEAAAAAVSNSRRRTEEHRRRFGGFLRKSLSRRRKATLGGDEDASATSLVVPGGGGRDSSGGGGAKLDPVAVVYAWLHGVLVDAAPSTATPATAAKEDEGVCNALVTRPGRAAFARVLQCQCLCGSGLLAAPLSGALGSGHGVLAQLQPLLGLGITPWLLSYPPLTGSLATGGQVPGSSGASSSAAAAAGAASANVSTAASASALLVAGIASAALAAATSGSGGINTTSRPAEAAPSSSSSSSSSSPLGSPSAPSDGGAPVLRSNRQQQQSSSLPFRGPAGVTAARTLLAQRLSGPSFHRLARVCAHLARLCDDDRDYVSAAAVLQVAFYYYTESKAASRGGAATALRPRLLLSTCLLEGGDFSLKGGVQLQLDSGPALWGLGEFWEAYVAQAVAVEEQLVRILQLPLRLPQLLTASSSNGSSVAAGKRATAAAAAAASRWPTSVAMSSMIQSLLGTMLRAGVPLDDAVGECSMRDVCVCVCARARIALLTLG